MTIYLHLFSIFSWLSVKISKFHSLIYRKVHSFKVSYKIWKIYPLGVLHKLNLKEFNPEATSVTDVW